MVLLKAQERHACAERLGPAPAPLPLAAGFSFQQRDELGVVEVGLILLASDL
jgi:hypothetical protein